MFEISKKEMAKQLYHNAFKCLNLQLVNDNPQLRIILIFLLSTERRHYCTFLKYLSLHNTYSIFAPTTYINALEYFQAVGAVLRYFFLGPKNKK